MVRRLDILESVMLWARKIAVVLAIIAALSFGALVAFSPDVRAAISNTTMRWFDGFVNFIGAEYREVGAEPGGWWPHYLPEGFVPQDLFETPDIFSVIFENQDGEEIWLTIIPADMLLAVNTDGIYYSEVVIEGITYHHFKAYDEDTFNSTIVWYRDDYSFELFSDIDMYVLQRVALGVVR